MKYLCILKTFFAIMCNCFGGNKKNKPEDKSPPTSSKPKTVVTRQPKSGKVSPRTTKIFSSPSAMKTVELTEIFEVPSKQFETTVDVIDAHGFVLGDELGKGTYATVYKAVRRRDGLPLACKILELSPSASKNSQLAAKNELFIMERVNHPNIVKLYKHFIVDLTESRIRQVYIFMQMATGNSLSVHMRKVKMGLSEQDCKRKFAQMVSAVNHMHQKGIAHRDLKMGNILLDKHGNCLVADFGLSRVSYRASKGGTIMSNKYCGTMPYMAPEILLSRKYKVEYNPFMVDIWALGVLLYCMINRGYPFSDSTTMLDKQLEHKIKFRSAASFKPSEELTALLNSLLEPSVEERITMDQLIAHPWMSREMRQVEEEAKRAAESERSDSSYSSRPSTPKD